MSRLLEVVAPAVIVASALAGCTGMPPTAGGGEEESSAGPTLDLPSREPPDGRFYDNWSEVQRMVSDHTIQLPMGTAWKEGNGIVVDYLANSTAVDLSIVLTWDAKHDLERELEIENTTGDVGYVGPSPLTGRFSPSQGEDGEERFFIWPGGDPVGFTHEMSIQIEVSVLYESPVPS